MTELPNGQRQEHLTDQRQALLQLLTSDQHYHETPTLAYGLHNPFEVPLASCDTCFAEADLARTSKANGPPRWQVVCNGCGKKGGDIVHDPCTASLMWNGVNLQTQRYTDLPLFALAGLAPRDAHIRIKRIRSNLELRIALCDIESRMYKARLSQVKPGVRYRARLDAYLKWTMLAHRLIKLAKVGGRSSIKEVEWSAVE